MRKIGLIAVVAALIWLASIWLDAGTSRRRHPASMLACALHSSTDQEGAAV